MCGSQTRKHCCTSASDLKSSTNQESMLAKSSPVQLLEANKHSIPSSVLDEYDFKGTLQHFTNKGKKTPLIRIIKASVYMQAKHYHATHGKEFTTTSQRQLLIAHSSVGKLMSDRPNYTARSRAGPSDDLSTCCLHSYTIKLHWYPCDCA